MNPSYETREIGALTDLAAVVTAVEWPVLLVEGIRALPDAERPSVVRMGRMLAECLPGVVFRSGNAEGTDTAFAEGVTVVAPARMEYVVTNAGMGRQRRVAECRMVELAALDRVAAEPLAEYTVRASPKAKGLVDAYRAREGRGPLGARAAFLLRDTLKVVGSVESGLAPATAGLFYVNERDPLSGGTGHTIRVCMECRVPVVLQTVWRKWI